MKQYTEDEYLMLSGIQHFIFCRRQWALIHIEQQWEENYRTVDGDIMHRRVHNEALREKRGDLIIARGMSVSSPYLGISGQCDMVEFYRCEAGIELPGEQGEFFVTPVEYKRGSPKVDESDKMQLAAQAMCLEDMLCCEVTEGYLYYGETRHRQKVKIDEELRKRTKDALAEMHALFERGYTPKAKRTKTCNACSLKNICLPMMHGKKKASDYIRRCLEEEEYDEKIT